jgi:hypothetical protein
VDAKDRSLAGGADALEQSFGGAVQTGRPDRVALGGVDHGDGLQTIGNAATIPPPAPRDG